MLRTPSGRVRAVVSGVRDIIGFPAGSPAGYSVLFTPTARVPDGIYRIAGDRLGSATLFLANVGHGEDAQPGSSRQHVGVLSQTRR